MESSLRFAHALGPGTDQARTAGGPRPQRPRKNQGVGDFPGVLARATRCDRGPVAVRTSHRQLTGDGRFMERALFRFFRMDRSEERRVGVESRLCEPQHLATTKSSEVTTPRTATPGSWKGVSRVGQAF